MFHWIPCSYHYSLYQHLSDQLNHLLLFLSKMQKILPKMEKSRFFPSNWIYTVWIFVNFFITHILLEIRVGDFGGQKTAILTQLEALNFNFDEFLHFLKSELTKLTKSRAPKIKIISFSTSRFFKIDFT